MQYHRFTTFGLILTGTGNGHLPSLVRCINENGGHRRDDRRSEWDGTTPLTPRVQVGSARTTPVRQPSPIAAPRSTTESCASRSD